MDKPFLLQFNTVFGKWFYCFSLFWYAKFCPPFVPQKYSSKIYILIYNTLYNINIVCIVKNIAYLRAILGAALYLQYPIAS